ncbi:hypothetical protein EDD18DRAFT_1361809 [Armillaria luteobubalina]|uniref:Uncharacterized protein n=1 Tax=Armillaria luteobubalina TaxID=153913 RepID=A0AA39PIA1_9AGAR|nr:hypothetical protein EDD18DRAFT_1361809 [Armillaria luteobubalina]
MSTDPMLVHLPFFEWENTSMGLVLPTNHVVTRHPPIVPIPALSDVPLSPQASPSPKNHITIVFNIRESNSTIGIPPFDPLAVKCTSHPAPSHFHRPQTGYGPHKSRRPSNSTSEVLTPRTPPCARMPDACMLPNAPPNGGHFFSH